jgi:NAD(P)-dependent dehydrogenase (short-subunit alcohol dehydrogenase family)
MDKQTFLEKLKLSKVLRIAIGSSIAIFLAETIGLRYSTSAGIITFLASEDARYISGQTIIADGGMSCHNPTAVK